MGAGKIAAQLNAEADMIGKPWGKERIRYILSNEKYIGDSLFQKTFTPNVLPLKNRPNRGEVEMYYISNTHAPAIDRELFGTVQEMLKRNMQKKAKCAKSGKYSLSGKLYCGDCGWRYISRQTAVSIYSKRRFLLRKRQQSDRTADKIFALRMC